MLGTIVSEGQPVASQGSIAQSPLAGRENRQSGIEGRASEQDWSQPAMSGR